MKPKRERDSIEALLRAAGRRTEPEARRRKEAKEAARAAWQAKVSKQREVRRSQRRRLAAAALVIVTLGGFLAIRLSEHGSGGKDRGSRPELLEVASVERIDGAVRSVGSAGDASGSKQRSLAVGDVLYAHDLVETGDDTRLALRLASGTGLRIDAGSRLRLVDTHRIDLDSGALYADSGIDGDVPASSVLEVRTPWGVARDVGTQFLVRVEEARLEVLVREGRVDLEHAAGIHSAAAGEGLAITESSSIERLTVPLSGTAWRWVVESTPPFDLEGRSVADLLDWVARETGWEIRYAEPGLHADVREIYLHGSIPALLPNEAPAVVLPTAGLEPELRGEILTISRPAS